jgi:hypothetical protein
VLLLFAAASCCRVIQPQVVDLLHLAAVYILVWMGAFLATVLAGNYYAEVETWSDSYGERRPRPTSWKVQVQRRDWDCSARSLCYDC